MNHLYIKRIKDINVLNTHGMQIQIPIDELKRECDKQNYRIDEEQRIIFIPYTHQKDVKSEKVRILSRKYFFNIQTEIV